MDISAILVYLVYRDKKLLHHDVIIYFRKPSADIVGDIIRPLRGTRFIIHEGTRGNIHTRLTR